MKVLVSDTSVLIDLERVSRGVMLPSNPFFITIFEPRVYGTSARLMVLSWWVGE